MPTSDCISAKQDTLRSDEPLAKGIQPDEQLISISKGNLKSKLANNYCKIYENKYYHPFIHAINQTVEFVTFQCGVNQFANESH